MGVILCSNCDEWADMDYDSEVYLEEGFDNALCGACAVELKGENTDEQT
jgi:hypothetical protein